MQSLKVLVNAEHVLIVYAIAGSAVKMRTRSRVLPSIGLKGAERRSTEYEQQNGVQRIPICILAPVGDHYDV